MTRSIRTLLLGVALSLLATKTNAAPDEVAVWDGSFLNNWSEAARWSTDDSPNNGATTYDVELTLGNVIQDVPGGVTINNLNLTDAFLSGAEPVTLVGDPSDATATSTWNAASQNAEIRNTGGVTVGPNATLELLGSGPKNLGAPGSTDVSRLTIEGSAEIVGAGALNATGAGGTVSTTATGTIDLQSDADFGSVGPAGRLENAGSFTKSAGASVSRFNNNWTIDNTGQFSVLSGTLEVRGDFDNFGDIAVNGATLRVDGDFTHSGSLTLDATATALFNGPVSGAASFEGAGAVTFNQAYAPGASTASIAFGGDVTLASNADLQIEVAGPEDHDALIIEGSLSLGGELSLAMIAPEGAEESFTPTIGDAFTIASAVGGVTGDFDSLSLPSTPLGTEWTVAINANDVVLFFDETPLPGDYNDDGVVDSADYTVWREGNGQMIELAADGNGDGVVNEGDYTVWAENYGAFRPSDAATAFAIPEPATALTASLALLAWAATGCHHWRP